MDESEQLYPEQSTTAIIAYHPVARYFSAWDKWIGKNTLDRINLHMDESEQLYPEQSTTAIVAYHPVARYFSAWDK
jgi:cobalamin-dependent methionine synthase I